MRITRRGLFQSAPVSWRAGPILPGGVVIAGARQALTGPTVRAAIAPNVLSLRETADLPLPRLQVPPETLIL